MNRLPLALLALAALAACREEDSSLTDQPKLEAWETSAIWADDAAARPWPEGVVRRDAPAPGAEMTPPEVDAALLARGRERFDIFCSPCHGLTGAGDGRVVERGFPQPPSLLSARLRDAPAEHFVRVIAEGYGVMFPYDDRVPAPDRWAIAAYIRALQAAEPDVAEDNPARALVPVGGADG
ncbi:c-type cytochrome [Roseivivax sediminis]|uniref:Cytochrome c553 n=1 Tax=Roseivivax sediminis TaxID=936889 RepID=A0A1I1X3Q3_9RHOB|nr:cytochrome c [Roseivivax sediminis]SFE01997.1 Cytochrome c553 [Roseivivax sediminis]